MRVETGYLGFISERLVKRAVVNCLVGAAVNLLVLLLRYVKYQRSTQSAQKGQGCFILVG